MPALSRHPVCLFLDSGFNRNAGMRSKPRDSEPEANKPAKNFIFSCTPAFALFQF